MISKKPFSRTRSTTLLVLLSGFAGCANAASIAINNWNFEQSVTFAHSSNGNSWNNAVAEWVSPDGATGELRPGSTAYDPLPPANGQNVAFSNGGRLYQSLGATFQSGSHYTLSVDIGHRLDVDFGGGSIALFAGDPATMVKTLTLSDPGDGLFSTQTLTLSTAEVAAFTGQTIGVLLKADGAQINFDNVQLNSLATPLPPAVWLFGSALVGLFGVARRKEKFW